MLSTPDGFAPARPLARTGRTVRPVARSTSHIPAHTRRACDGVLIKSSLLTVTYLPCDILRSDGGRWFLPGGLKLG
jgi:hypothetical protein